MTEKATVHSTYHEKGNGPPCRLSKADIVSLEQILRTDLGEDARFNIETTLPSAELSAPTAETFFESNLLPDTLTQLSLSCYGRSPFPYRHQIYVGLTSTNVFLRITSENHEWAIGRHAAITRFLRERRPWYWPIVQFFATPTLMWFSIFVYVVSLPVAWYLGQPTIARGIIYGFMVIGWPLYIASWLGVFSYVKVRVRPKVRDQVATQTKVMIIAILVTLIAPLLDLIMWLIARQSQP